MNSISGLFKDSHACTALLLPLKVIFYMLHQEKFTMQG